MNWQHCVLSPVVRRSCYMVSREVTGNIAAVLAFKTVYTLELKRRNSEKKIIALYVEMKDMMGVLLQCVVTFTYHASLADITQAQRCAI
jgi:hypothetical protein